MLEQTRYMTIYLNHTELNGVSIRNYSTGLRKFSGYLEKLGITDWQELDFNEFYEDPETGRKYPMDKELIESFIEWLRLNFENDGTVSQYYLSVRNWFQTLHQCGAILFDPTANLDVRFHDRRRRTSVLTDQEFRRLVQVALIRDPLTLKYVSILLLLHIGLRNQELRMLQFHDLDFNLQVIHLVRGTKRGKPRDVPMTEQLSSAIKKYTESIGREQVYLFPSSRNPNKIMSAKTLEDIVHQLSQTAGITKSVFPHLFRHTGLTRLYRLGVSPRDIQQIAGHGDVKTTEGYIHISAEEQRPYLENSPMNNVLKDVLGTTWLR